MPIPISPFPVAEPLLFPPPKQSDIDAARTSRWYETFEDLTVPTTIIDLGELGERELFLEWLEADSIFIPQDSDPTTQASSSRTRPRSDSTSSGSSSSSSSAPVYHLPKLNAAIRDALERHGGGVFPKLNWTSPRDAAFLLPQTSHGPLHCSSPADVYLLLKSSDFISHGLDPARAYEGTEASGGDERENHEKPEMKIELVLKKYVQVNPAREVRCFVRNDILIGISMRDMNYYDHLQREDARSRICDTVRSFWEDEIRGDYEGGEDYIFDLLLSDNSTPPTIIDFNPYRASTDSLLFTYSELHDILLTSLEPLPHSEDGLAKDPRPRLPILKVVDSPTHPEANRGAPAFGTNMMPLEMVEMSQGRSLEEFRAVWDEVMAAGILE